MENQLFVVCPFACLETILQKKFGENSFFISSSAGVLQFNDNDQISELTTFILRENIKTIFIVNDISCQFIKGVVERQKLNGLYSEKIIEDLYIDHYFSHFNNQPADDQKVKLAELNTKTQLTNLLKILPLDTVEFGIKIKGLLIKKETNFFKVIN
jgi:carbonic anhydrase